jgi:hypothetical protein
MNTQTTSVAAVFVLCLSVVMGGCATSMTPRQFNEALPKSTKSRFYGRTAANDAVAAGQCRLLVADRKYTSPIGMTVNGDLDGAARGIDEWVSADRGNAYSVGDFAWATVGDSGATQLTVRFDTLSCK